VLGLTVSQGAQQVKDNGFDARFILVEAGDATAETEPRDFYDAVAKDFDSLKAAIFGPEGEPPAAPGDGDVSMADGVTS
jgi:THO complex subunit 1